MRRVSIKTTLSSIFVALGLVVAGLSAGSLNELAIVNDKVGVVVNVWMPSLELVNDIEVRLGDIRTAYRSHILRHDTDGKAAAIALINRSVKLLETDADAYEVLNFDPLERDMLRR